MKKERRVRLQEERPEDLLLLMNRKMKHIDFGSILGIDFVLDLTICCNLDLSCVPLILLVCMVKLVVKPKYCGPDS